MAAFFILVVWRKGEGGVLKNKPVLYTIVVPIGFLPNYPHRVQFFFRDFIPFPTIFEPDSSG